MKERKKRRKVYDNDTNKNIKHKGQDGYMNGFQKHAGHTNNSLYSFGWMELMYNHPGVRQTFTKDRFSLTRLGLGPSWSPILTIALLWKFLLDELNSHNNNLRWIDILAGTFRFIDTLEVSRKWGEVKENPGMNFEKLSRGLRHYYQTRLMRRMDGTRLVYKFNWRKLPQDCVPVGVKESTEFGVP